MFGLPHMAPVVNGDQRQSAGQAPDGLIERFGDEDARKATMPSATFSAYMKPVHAAPTSHAAAFLAPSRAWR